MSASKSTKNRNSSDPLETATATDVQIRDLQIYFGHDEFRKDILKGIDLDIPAGKITGLAGESGSGKTMTGLAMCGLLPHGAHVSGSIKFGETEIIGAKEKELNRLRGNRIAMVFQDPTASLHPMLSIERQLTDHYRVHTNASQKQAHEKAREMLELVAVPNPEGALKKYPHQFSGGQLQRIAIALALMCSPSILVADEPTTALDVTVQAGILRLMRRLCDELNLGILLITHDLGVMSSLANHIAVMRLGEIVEFGDTYQIINAPRHEYTQNLIDSLPEAAPLDSELHEAEMAGKNLLDQAEGESDDAAES
ncbi:ABC transporter ATP-binding protein [uncultured Mobiluncus sp.]|uniref:ABC transporter ATP-binding protein n=1 Tax=uncultured Mobiluncus sp. TaxID=293425 RepID=UPI0026349762|nr:ABC transporter ATP-binding protein [uncultured Mobiluncus sp.]